MKAALSDGNRKGLRVYHLVRSEGIARESFCGVPLALASILPAYVEHAQRCRRKGCAHRWPQK